MVIWRIFGAIRSKMQQITAMAAIWDIEVRYSGTSFYNDTLPPSTSIEYCLREFRHALSDRGTFIGFLSKNLINESGESHEGFAWMFGHDAYD